jgi:hypothetical protein
MKIAILDDYQNVALTMADWSRVESKAEVTGSGAAEACLCVSAQP